MPRAPLPHRLRLRALALVAALAPCFAARPAAAVALQDPASALSVELDVPGAKVCVILPKEARSPEACEDYDVEALEAGVAARDDRPSNVALVRFDDWSFVFTTSTQQGVKVRSAEQVGELVAGMADGAAIDGRPARALGGAAGSTYDLLERNGVHVVATRLEPAVLPDDARRAMSGVLMYGVVGQSQVTMLAFITAPERLDALRPIADGVVGTISMPNATIPSFGRSRSYFMGKLVGQIAFFVAGAAALVVLFARARRKNGKKRARRPAPP